VIDLVLQSFRCPFLFDLDNGCIWKSGYT